MFWVVYNDNWKLERAGFKTKQEAFDFATSLLSSQESNYGDDDIMMYEGENILFNIKRELLVTVTENREE